MNPNNLWRGLLLIACLTLAGALASCGKTDSSDPSDETPEDTVHWRYFDREIYLPTGISVKPEMAAAHEIVRKALSSLEESTDLGKDFFIFKADEDSILQPVTTPTAYQGRNWRSFIQVWDEAAFNEFVSEKVGVAIDQDTVVAQNEKNTRQYFIVLRLACFVASDACSFATQAQAISLVWRSYGYLIGLRFGDSAASAVMRAGMSPEQESEAERGKFFAEFDNMLEKIKNNL
jgi:hypothetical protein